MPLSKLGLHTNTLTHLVRRVYQHIGFPPSAPVWRTKKDEPAIRTWHKEQVEQVTVKAVTEAWESSSSNRGWYENGRVDCSMKKFITRLEELGLTKVDWIHLPQRSLVKETRASRTKNEWLGQCALVLGTLTSNAQCDLRRRFSKNANQVSVQELLTVPFSTSDQIGPNGWHESFANTVKKLRTLGFSRADGPFMPATNEEREADIAEQVVKNHKVSKSFAQRVAYIARMEGWI